MTARVTVTAGPHDIGFTFKERPGQPQDVWQPAARDSQEIHFIGGLPKLKTVGVEGPYNVTGISSTPSRERVFVCKPAASATAAAQSRAVRQRVLSNLAKRAYRRPVTAEDLEAPLAFYTDARGAAAAASTPASAPASRASSPAPISSTGSSATAPGVKRGRRASGQRRRARVAAVVLPVEQHPGRAPARSGDRRPAPPARRARRRSAAHDCRQARRRAGQQLRRSVAAAAEPGVEGPPGHPRCSPTSTTTSARRSAARPSCSSPTSSARTAARWSC